MTFLYALIKIHSTRQNFPETRYKGMYKKVFVRVKDAIEELESMPKKLRKTFVVRRFRFIGKGLPKQGYLLTQKKQKLLAVHPCLGTRCKTKNM